MYSRPKVIAYVRDRYAAMKPYFIGVQIFSQDVETTGRVFPAATVTTDKTQSSNTIEPEPLCATLSLLLCVNILPPSKAPVSSSESETVALI